MKITKKWLEEKKACASGIDYVAEKGWLDLEGAELAHKLAAANQIDYTHWLFKNILTHKNLRLWAIYSAEQVLPIWAAYNPDNDTPQRAIAAAKADAENPMDENRMAARAAAEAAWDAAGDTARAAAWAAADAARAARAAAWAAADAAGMAAAWAARAARAAAWAAAWAAWTAWTAWTDRGRRAAWDAAGEDAGDAAGDAKKEMQLKIINYGFKLLKQQKTEE